MSILRSFCEQQDSNRRCGRAFPLFGFHGFSTADQAPTGDSLTYTRAALASQLYGFRLPWPLACRGDRACRALSTSGARWGDLCLKPDGRSDFYSLLVWRAWPFFYAFDVLFLNGRGLGPCRCWSGSGDVGRLGILFE